RLAEHKKATGKFLNPVVIDIEDVYREFSGGNHDPGAIRNFLMYVHNSNNWSIAPDYVLLFGGGHYDYKGYDTDEINYITTAQIDFKCIEDFFSCINAGEYVMMNDSVAPDLFLGRIPHGSILEAKDVVDKIIDTEGPDADYGAWRNRLLLVSDDDMAGNEKDFIQHFKSNESVEEIVKLERPSLEVRKVMLFEYEWNEIYQKPEASSALFNEINNGVSCVNYFGHGSENAWADEAILVKDKICNFHNSKRYPIINSFSCSVGRFDEPDRTC
ncbi:unnamed protein product, partial [marine sediment metagenome]